jgi:hypothetical protein
MNRTHAWDSAIWRDTIPTQPGLLTEQHLDTRIRERAAVMDLAEQIDRERRQGAWPARRASGPLSTCTGPCQQGRLPCPCPDACTRADRDDGDADGFGFWRGLLLALAVTALCGVVALAGAHLVPWRP